MLYTVVERRKKIVYINYLRVRLRDETESESFARALSFFLFPCIAIKMLGENAQKYHRRTNLMALLFCNMGSGKRTKHSEH